MGHECIIRPVFDDDELDWLTQHSYQERPCSGGPVTIDTVSPVSTVQQVEVVSRTEVAEYQSLIAHCKVCDQTHVCKIQSEIRKA